MRLKNFEKPIRFAVGLLLLPVFVGTLRALLDQLSNWMPPWAAERYFVTGVGAGAVAFWLWPSQPGRLYVLGHELTHALWGKMFGAKVRGISVSEREGSVRLSKVNLLTTLAPYFFPFYAGIAVLLYYAARLMSAPSWIEPACLGLIGLCMVWHWVATYRTVRMGQPDFKQAGVLFSTVLTAWLNLIVLALLLKIVSPQRVRFGGFLQDSGVFSFHAYKAIFSAALAAARWVRHAGS